MKLFFSLLIIGLAQSPAAINVAIIGGGIGGASTAYFLNEMKPDDLTLDLDLYEHNKLGGRLATFQHNGHFYETGGSVIHSKNYFMKHFVDKFGLEVRTSCSEDFGIFNGTELLFKSSHYNYVTALKLWWRYGSDIFKLDSFITEMMSSFQRIYEIHEDSNYPFSSTDELLSYVGNDLHKSLNISTYAGFIEKDFSKKFVEEFVACIIRCNYCQSLNIHHFVGSVAVAGAGADLWSVKGGNKKVAEKLIETSGTTVITEKVKSISTFKNNTKLLVSTDTRNTFYDYVVVATPFTSISNIQFHGFNTDYKLTDSYHYTVCTLIQGELNPNFFNTHKESLPSILLFTDQFYINALAKINPVDGDCNPDNQIWKVFSDIELVNSQLEAIFRSHRVLSTTDWLAYPEYKSVALNKSFNLFNTKNLLHLNAIEALASAMEMSAIGAHNVAALVIKDINNQTKPVPAFVITTYNDEF